MRYLVAVSGGVDSVVLLDMLVKRNITTQNESLQGVPLEGEEGVIVAHFDHGIREDSASDAQFVADLAKNYGLLFEMRREELGKDASEELARDRRYEFLRSMAKKHNAKLVTAHHLNDIAETIAINVARGTGWRGVAVLASDVYRPLLGMTKQDILEYAEQHNLEWREDSTNASDAYMRNRLRRRLTDADTVMQLAALRARQVELKDMIDDEIHDVLSGDGNYSRYFFTAIPSKVALELLRDIAIRQFETGLTRPQLERSLLAIKTAKPGTMFPFGRAELSIGKNEFSLSVKTP